MQPKDSKLAQQSPEEKDPSAAAGAANNPVSQNGQDHTMVNLKRLSRILIVEDSPTQAQRLQLILEDGKKGSDLLLASAFDLVISDIQMPGMSGYELCCKIKTDPAPPQNPRYADLAERFPPSPTHRITCWAVSRPKT